MAQGLLTDRYLKGIPEDSRASKSHGFLQKEHITNKLIEKVRDLHKVAVKRGQSLAQMAIAWLLKDKRITSVLIGVSSVEQLQNNLTTLANASFDENELQEIEKILNR